MAKKIVLIHGRNFKPEKEALKEIWLGALRHGIKRDHDTDILGSYDAVAKSAEFVYFGDVSNAFLRKRGREYDAEDDISNRRRCLEELKRYSRDGFLGKTGRANYEDLPGKSSLKEIGADLFAGPMNLLSLSDNLIKKCAPDMQAYWKQDSSPYGSKVRWRLTEPLKKSLLNGDDVLLISHSLGTMIAYDTLWKFSYYGEHQEVRDKKLSVWVTLGSPLGNETVKDRLKGANAKGNRRYPVNIKRWINVAAEDDYIAHDESVNDDYDYMEDNRMLDSITDIRIYNLAVRCDKSNPHSSTGYLIHPNVAAIVAGWLAT